MNAFNWGVLITLFLAQMALSDNMAIVMNVGENTRKLCIYDGADGSLLTVRDKFNIKPGEVRIIKCKPEGRGRCKVLNRGRGNKCSDKRGTRYGVSRNSVVHLDGPIFKYPSRTSGAEMDAFARGSTVIRAPICTGGCNQDTWVANSNIYQNMVSRYGCVYNFKGCNVCPTQAPTLGSNCYQGHLDYNSHCVTSGPSRFPLYCNSNMKWERYLVSRCAAKSDSTTLGISLPSDTCFTHSNVDCVYKANNNNNYMYNCENGMWIQKGLVDKFHNRLCTKWYLL
eukprot:Awhi_evm1s15581